MRLYLFKHPYVAVSFGVLAHSRKEALEVLHRERPDVWLFVHRLNGIEPTVLDKPSVVYVEGVHQGY